MSVSTFGQVTAFEQYATVATESPFGWPYCQATTREAHCVGNGTNAGACACGSRPGSYTAEKTYVDP